MRRDSYSNFRTRGEFSGTHYVFNNTRVVSKPVSELKKLKPARRSSFSAARNWRIHF